MIDEQAALDIAKARAAENGWAFLEPFSILLRRGWWPKVNRYEIGSCTNRFGAKARFVIDADTGAVLEQGYIPL